MIRMIKMLPAVTKINPMELSQSKVKLEFSNYLKNLYLMA